MAAPMAAVGLDVNRDGRADYIVSGVDMNRDGIPDALQQRPVTYQSQMAYSSMAAPMAAPMAAVGLDVNRDGRADYIVSGVDMNRDGIPDALQQRPLTYQSQMAYSSMAAPMAAPMAAVGLDVNRDGR